MTSLQKQLAVIASNSHNELDLKAQKTAHSKSLLFEPAVASTQSFDVLYQICLEGFEELCGLDKRFLRFSRSLFSPQSRTEDRMQLTAQENKDLDHVVESFLAGVSGRLLLRPGLKAVEWLIRRFRIHDLNTGATILAFLPHHTNPLFTALLSILPKQLPPTFKFLHSYKSTLSNPPLSAIVQSAVHNQSFFMTLNNHVLTGCKSKYPSSALLSLWATTAAQTVDTRLSSARSGRAAVQNEKTEDLLMQLLPMLSEGLSIRKVPDYVLGCYMIIVILVSKIDLDDRTLVALLAAVITSWSAETFESGLSCAAAIAQCKEHPALPESTVKTAMRFEGLAVKLGGLSQHQNVHALVAGLVEGAIVGLSLSSVFSQEAADFCVGVARLGLINRSEVDRVSGSIETATSSDAARAPNEGPGRQETSRLLSAMKECLRETQSPELSLPAPEHFALMDATNGAASEHENLTYNFEQLPKKLNIRSFLSTAASSVVNQFVTCFEQASDSQAELKAFTNLDVWTQDHHSSSQLICSLYLKVLCSSKRTQTISTAAKQLSVLVRDTSAKDLDFQALIIYSLLALSDKNHRVRRDVAELVTSIAKHMEAAEDELSSSWRLYGHSSPLPSLSGRTLQNFVRRSLLKELEECVADPQQVGRLLEHAMRGSSANPSRNEDTGKRLKSAQREELFRLLSGHIDQVPDAHIKTRLLRLVVSVDRISGRPRSTFLLQAFKSWVGEQSLQYCTSATKEHSYLCHAYVDVAHPKDDEFVSYLVSISIQHGLETSPDLQLAALRRFQEIWVQLKSPMQSCIATRLLQASRLVAEDVRSHEASKQAAGLLRSLPIPTEILSDLLSALLTPLETSTEPATKRRRTGTRTSIQSNQPEFSAKLEHDLRQLSLCLELVDAAPASPDLRLFYQLFNALQALQSYQTRTAAEIDFPQVLALNNLLSLARSIRSSPQKITVDTSLVRVDPVIDCMKKTSNSQARNAAIGLLSILSESVPKDVLHNIISVFTLISTTTMRQDDEHSIQLVDQAIQEIVPRLADALRKQKVDVVASTEDIIWSFAAAYEHIPHVRRLRLYRLLASSLGPQDCLYAIIASLADRWPANARVDRFAAALMKEFSPEVGFETLHKYANLMWSALTYDPTRSKLFLVLPKAAAERSEKLSAWLRVLTGMAREGWNGGLFRHTDTTDSSRQRIKSLFRQTLQTVLQLSSFLSNDENVKDVIPQTLEHLLRLLTLDDFLDSIAPLLANSNENVSRSVLKALEVQLRLTKSAGSAAKRSALNFLPTLSAIAKSRSKGTALRLNAVVCVDRICEDYGKMDAEKTFATAQIITSCLDDEDTLMRALCMHCLASMVEVLQDRFIPLLQKSLQTASDCLAQTLSRAHYDARLHNAALSLIISITEHLSYMISPATLVGLMEHGLSSVSASTGSEAKENRQHLFRVIAEKMEARTVFEAASQSWSHAVSQGPAALHELVALLKSSADLQPKSAISKQARALLSTFLTFFDLRRIVALKITNNSVTDVQLTSLEREVIAVLLSLILKITDATFRPFFVQLVEWTTESPSSDKQGQQQRLITVFYFIHTMSDRLKSLVTPYFAYVIEPAAETLRSTTDVPKAGNAAHQLTVAALEALKSSFQYDQEDLISSPPRFALLHPAVIAQLPLHNPAPNSSLTQTHAIPALVAFASAISSVPDHLNQLNASLLALLKGHQPAVLVSASGDSNALVNGDHDDAASKRATKTVRWTDKKLARNGKLAAVMAMRALTRELGEEWLGMLPQMLPMVNELMEDGDERVADQTARWIKEIEATIGESISDMLA